MSTFLHAGDTGDLIMSLGCIDLKRDTLYLTSKPWLTREPMTPAKFRFISSLLPVRWWTGERIDNDLTGFRDRYQRGVNLAEQQARYVGLTVKPRPWLHLPNRPPRTGTLCSRSARYHDPDGHGFWVAALRRNRPEGFIGTAEEHQAWSKEFGIECPHLHFPTLKAMATAIAGARLLIANQSLPFALATALGVDTLLESCPQWDDCQF